MRPVRIRAEGFSAYRSAVDVDLTGVEFFSLSGATGSGKSSLLDAMVFALYGRVPRLGGNAVAPAITAGADVARVALDFEVGGVEHTVVRMAVRTSGGGASVKEARLQQGEDVLADGADNVTAAVEDLLRLRFEDFTRTVVLPQGDFARFLTAAKAEKQSLLRSLLGLDVYSTMRSLAKSREKVARERFDFAGGRLDALQLPDQETLAASSSRLVDLAGLSEKIVDREQALAALRDAVTLEQGKVERHDDALTRLEALRPPGRLEQLHADLEAGRDALQVAVEELGRRRDVLVSLEEKRADLPTQESIQSQRQRYDRLASVIDRMTGLGIEELQTTAARHGSAVEKARQAAEEADRLLEEAKSSHTAHSLRSRLMAGDPCPVCGQEVGVLTDGEVPPAIQELEARKGAAVEALSAAAAADEAARLELARAESTHDELEEQRAELAGQLASAPSVDELTLFEKDLAAVADEIRIVAEGVDTAARAEGEAQRRLESLSEAVRSVGRDLMAARQSVADLEPPIPESDDPLIQWKELLQWRDQAVSDTRESRQSGVAAAEKAKAIWTESRQTLVSELEALGIEANEPFSVEVARETTALSALVERHQTALAEAASLRQMIADSETEASVAATLAKHLRADGFEQWLMVGAFAGLVAGANGLLAQLSDGGYSLQTDDVGSFSIIDHRNADEVRPVSTLSGGETFLVSLALALSLAEALASGGGAELDAIILDEGFGSLDGESLDIVASVLEELAGDGLMVGVITHVKELAARAPVRFEVSRGAAGSQVEVAT